MKRYEQSPVDGGLAVEPEGTWVLFEDVKLCKWQPIETAPKDGTKIDLWMMPGQGLRAGARITDCWWRNGKWTSCFDPRPNPSWPDSWFSHWSPILEPPTE